MSSPTWTSWMRRCRATCIAVVLLVPVICAAANGVPESQHFTVHRNGSDGDALALTMGLPMPPGALTNPDRVRILDDKGIEIPAHVESVLRWHTVDDSIRAVKVQFHAQVESDHATFAFTLDQPREQTIDGWPYTQGLTDVGNGLRVPAALATLDPRWLTASLVAGPQVPFDPDQNAYDRFVQAQFGWAEALPTTDPHAWLFDRTSTLFKLYVRSGRVEHLRAAVLSYRFYMSKLVRNGPVSGRQCGGGWAFAAVNSCDVKYVYIEPILLALALTGDDSLHDNDLVDKMAALWADGGWSGIRGPYTRTDQLFTERQMGLGLLATVSAYEITGDARHRQRIDDRIGWLLDHQQKNPDHRPADGAWRHSWQQHEGDAYDAATDIRGASPWMSENIIDGLWHAWLVTGDARVPGMMTAFGQYLEKHGWIEPSTFERAGHSWRDDCSGEHGEIAWYWSSSLTDLDTLIQTQDNEGWYSDAHTVELGLPVAAALYFETDAGQRAALQRRLDGIAHSYNVACARSRKPPRKFNWNNRGASVVQWLIRQPAAGADGRATPMAGTKN